MTTISEKQTKNLRIDNSSNQLTENELLLIYGGDETGKPIEEGGDENG